MTLTSLLIFLIPVLTGTLVIHLLWPERQAIALLLKLSLGVGLGLGTSSILYFLSLLIAPGRLNMLAAQGLLLVILLIVTIRQERRREWPVLKIPPLSRLEWGMLGLTVITAIFSVLVFVNLTIARPQGSFDAWGIWNRAARFIYRDPENWRATLSPDLFWLMHPDYPLLIPLNVAWGWEVVGIETYRVPIVQSALFLFATLGLLFAAVGLLRTFGQAGLACLALVGAPSFFLTGYGQISDVPLAYFILAAGVLMFLYLRFKRSSLLMLSGFMAGLAAWTKNEGLLFVIVSLSALILVSRKNIFGPLAWYLAGLAIPLAVVLYFKTALAPASEFIPSGEDDLLAKIIDPSRYWLILQALKVQALTFPGWPFSPLIQLAIYALIMRLDYPPESTSGIRALAALILLQLLGYCAIYIVTPYDLQTHLHTSLGRLVLQLFPAGIFLFFSMVSPPEKVFQRLVEKKQQR